MGDLPVASIVCAFGRGTAVRDRRGGAADRRGERARGPVARTRTRPQSALVGGPDRRRRRVCAAGDGTGARDGAGGAADPGDSAGVRAAAVGPLCAPECGRAELGAGRRVVCGAGGVSGGRQSHRGRRRGAVLGLGAAAGAPARSCGGGSRTRIAPSRPGRRALLLGTAGGLLFGLAAALTQYVTGLLEHGLGAPAHQLADVGARRFRRGRAVSAAARISGRAR